MSEKPKIDTLNIKNNDRTLSVGPSFSGNAYLMLKILSRIPNQDICIITKSPPEEYSQTKIKIKEIGEEIKAINEYEKAVKFFDDTFGS